MGFYVGTWNQYGPWQPEGNSGVGGPAARLGFRQIKGMWEEDGRRIAGVRLSEGPFKSVEEVQRRASIDGAVMTRLAKADAFGSLNLTRRESSWEAMGMPGRPASLVGSRPTNTSGAFRQLPLMPAIDEVFADYSTTGLSLKRHPVSFARQALSAEKVITASKLQEPKLIPGRWVRVAGLVLVRQRPGTASGVVFITLEDETGIANLILWADVYERFRAAARHSTLLQADGLLRREGKVIQVLAQRLHDRASLLQGISQHSRDFH